MSEELFVTNKKNIKKGLGRGLGSLLGEIDTSPPQNKNVSTTDNDSAPKPTPNINTTTFMAQPKLPPKIEKSAELPSSERIYKVGIEKIVANFAQPRKHFDQTKLQELANSIKEKGIILPIIVRPMPSGNYQIIAGERRWRAAQLAGLHEVPTIFKSTNDGETLELALIENIQRHDLNPMEEAEAYGVLANKYSLTQAQIADKVSKDRSTVANLMRILGLTPEVRGMVKTGDLSLGQAKVLLGLTDPGLQIQAAKKSMKQKLSVRALEKLIEKIKKQGDANIESDEKTLKADELAPVVTELQKISGTKVEVQAIGNGAKVAFYFYSVPELNQFIEKLRKTTP